MSLKFTWLILHMHGGCNLLQFCGGIFQETSYEQWPRTSCAQPTFTISVLNNPYTLPFCWDVKRLREGLLMLANLFRKLRLCLSEEWWKHSTALHFIPSVALLLVWGSSEIRTLFSNILMMAWLSGESFQSANKRDQTAADILISTWRILLRHDKR